MTQLEYLIALVSIIVGLGLADLARTLRELVRPGREVRWHWLPLTWAAIAFMAIVQIWWGAFQLLQDELFAEASAFMLVLLEFLLLYLSCAFALPDPAWTQQETPSGPDPTPGPGAAERTDLDLEAFYFSTSHRRWFFGTFIGLLVVTNTFNVIKWALVGEQAIEAARLIRNAGANLAIASLLVGLIVTDRWWVHAGTALLVAGAATYTLVAGLPTLG